MSVIDLDQAKNGAGGNPWQTLKPKGGRGGGGGGFNFKLPAGSFPILIVAALIAAGMFIYTGIYTVPSDSVGLVTRFGKYLKEEPSGLHFKIPWGADDVTIVPVKRQLKQEFGFGTRGATNQTQIGENPQAESQMVTGDLNAALVEWVVQYRIEEPRK